MPPALKKFLISQLIGWPGVGLLVLIIIVGTVSNLEHIAAGAGSTSGSASVFSQTVESYRGYADIDLQQQGLSVAYDNSILAIMQVISSGQGTDIMAASGFESNKKYPHTKGGILDPFYSLSCGISEFKALLGLAGVTSPGDKAGLLIVYQAYVTGRGYVTYALAHGGYVDTTVAQYLSSINDTTSSVDPSFASEVAALVDEIENPDNTPGGDGGGGAVVAVALAQLGNYNGQKFWSWEGFSSRIAWCACFVSWCEDQCGYIKSGVVINFINCDVAVAHFQSKGQWHPGGYKPSPGDIIFFSWGMNGTADHTGIVESSISGTVKVVAGNNSKNEVGESTWSVSDPQILGYGTPPYPAADAPSGGLAAFMDAVGQLESGGDYYAVNAGGYMGKYQMGDSALMDAGFMNSNTSWSDLAASYGVTNQASFLSHPKAQDAAYINFLKVQWVYIKAEKLDSSYIGTTFKGVMITPSGLIAACHLVGIGSLTVGLQDNIDMADANGTTMSTYMKKLAGYDVSAITK